MRLLASTEILEGVSADEPAFGIQARLKQDEKQWTAADKAGLSTMPVALPTAEGVAMIESDQTNSFAFTATAPSL